MQNLAPDDVQWQFQDEIRKAGDRAAGLTRQLLAFSRKQIPEPAQVNINQLIRDTRAMLTRLIGEDIEVVLDLCPDPGLILADPGQLHQVLMNLAINARDAMPEGGVLTIKTEAVNLGGNATPAVDSSAHRGGHVILTVSDTGVGMDNHVQQHLFEPFFTTKAAGKGTGLGLSTVYGIVTQAGGSIDVESQPGQGATFKVILARTAETEMEKKAAVPVNYQMKGSETILVVEDQEEVRNFTSRALRSHGYEVLEVSNGIEALETAARHRGPIHLMLSDVRMPGMSGADLAKQLGRLRPKIAVLLTSGYLAEGDGGRAVLSGGWALSQQALSTGCSNLASPRGARTSARGRKDSCGGRRRRGAEPL
jgi:two-component system, cell cycle sensor histidine kinase and response regulator CckA